MAGSAHHLGDGGEGLGLPHTQRPGQGGSLLRRIVVLPDDTKDVGVPDPHEGADVELSHEPSTHETDPKSFPCHYELTSG